MKAVRTAAGTRKYKQVELTPLNDAVDGGGEDDGESSTGQQWLEYMWCAWQSLPLSLALHASIQQTCRAHSPPARALLAVLQEKTARLALDPLRTGIVHVSRATSGHHDRVGPWEALARHQRLPLQHGARLLWWLVLPGGVPHSMAQVRAVLISDATRARRGNAGRRVCH
eukprot:scaffold1735_cov119-Isochrysis_galbana.AAC.4